MVIYYFSFRIHTIHVIISSLLFASLALIGQGALETIIAVDAFLVVPNHFADSTTAFIEARKITYASLSAKRTATENTSTIPDITRRMLAITKNPNIAIVIDLENVRGKTHFELDHADLLDRLMVWTSLRNHAKGRTVVVVDHGRKSSAHLLHGHNYHGRNDRIAHDQTDTAQGVIDNDDDNYDDDASMCVSFAGPRVKADDIIARDIKWLISSPKSSASHIVLITADQELTYRCRNAVRMEGKKIRTNTVPFSIDNVAHNSIIRSFLDDSKRFNGRRRGRVKQAREGGRKKKSRAARKLQTARQGGVKMEVNDGDDDDGEDDEKGTESNGDENEIRSNVTDTTAIDITDIDSDGQQEHNFTIPTIEVISPQRFLEDLGQSLLEWIQHEKGKHVSLPYKVDSDALTTGIASEGSSNPNHSSQYLFQLRTKTLSLESSLRSTCSLHKRKGLTGELRKCKEEWKACLTSIVANSDEKGYEEFNGDKQALFSSLACTFSSTISLSKSESNGGSATTSLSSTAWERLATRDQDKLLMATRQENTGDRIVLAERLRKQLLDAIGLDNPNNTGDHFIIINGEDSRTSKTATLASIYADYINTMLAEH